ncbi:MAG: arylsulfatase [Saonia sp.]
MAKCIWCFFMVTMVSCGPVTKEDQIIKSKSPPNVILIVSDDQGWGDLSIHGNTNLETPNIDSLSENGVTFSNFYVSPVCSPTRAELLTGRYHPRAGVYSTSAGGERLNLDETTMADVFKHAGYKTAAYGKWHNGMQNPYHPNSRGFDDFYGFCSGHWGNYFSPMLEHNGKIVQGKGFLVDDLTSRAINFIQKNKENPFFLYLPLNTPHSPMQVPEKFWTKFEHADLELKYQGAELENENFTRAALAMVENIDWNVGRIRNHLKQLHLEENTIVIYLSDNGPNDWRWNNGMRGKKGSTDEGGVLSPFFIQWKNRVPKGKTVNEIASAIDVLPTLTALTGVKMETAKKLDGSNLTPLIFANSIHWKPRLVYNHWKESTSIRTQKYRLDNEGRLYDMEEDLSQHIDVSEKFPTLTDSLKKARIQWEKDVLPIEFMDERPFPVGDPDFTYTQLPARDGVAHGNIERSNKYPNCSFFTNWIAMGDEISWDIEVLQDGLFEVEIYYTCSIENVGSVFAVEFGNNKLVHTITEAFDSPLRGMENDRDPRIESYVKDFKPLKVGTIELAKGRGMLVMKADHIANREVMDLRLILLKKLK